MPVRFPCCPTGSCTPERVPPAFHTHCLYADGELVRALEWALSHPDERDSIAAALRAEMMQFDWSVIAPRYDELLEGLAAQ